MKYNPYVYCSNCKACHGFFDYWNFPKKTEEKNPAIAQTRYKMAHRKKEQKKNVHRKFRHDCKQMIRDENFEALEDYRVQADLLV